MTLPRKIAKSIAEQDWSTFGIEILVVVVGIYLGLQVNDWSQDRDDQRAEIQYLERISTDLATSISATRDSTEFQKLHAGYGALILSSLRNCTLRPDERDRFATGIYLAGKYTTASFVKASLEELLTSGRSTIIRNASLRQRIIELLTEYEDHRFYMSDVQLRTTPHVNYLNSVAPVIVTEAISGGADIAWEQLEADFENLCSDGRFFSAIAATMNYTWDSTSSLIEWTERLSSLRDDIESELAILRADSL